MAFKLILILKKLTLPMRADFVGAIIDLVNVSADLYQVEAYFEKAFFVLKFWM